MATAPLIIHSLVAVALLGAISHQTLATWVPARARSGSFFGRFRAVPSASFANAIALAGQYSSSPALWWYWRFGTGRRAPYR
jgi:hypothetical protein